MLLQKKPTSYATRIAFILSVFSPHAAHPLDIPDVTAAQAFSRELETTLASLRQCAAYSQMESRAQCGAQGYLIGYGRKYCLQSLELERQLSDKGRAWAQSVRRSLVEHIQPLVGKSSCEELRRLAFQAHSSAYTQAAPSLCELSLHDQIAIARMVDTADLMSIAGLQQVAQTAAQCAAHYVQQALERLRTATTPDPRTARLLTDVARTLYGDITQQTARPTAQPPLQRLGDDCDSATAASAAQPPPPAPIAFQVLPMAVRRPRESIRWHDFSPTHYPSLGDIIRGGRKNKLDHQKP